MMVKRESKAEYNRKSKNQWARFRDPGSPSMWYSRFRASGDEVYRRSRRRTRR